MVYLVIFLAGLVATSAALASVHPALGLGFAGVVFMVGAVLAERSGGDS